MMKKYSLALIGVAALLAQSASAQVLFTTTNDFAWQAADGLTPTPVTSMDSDGSPINGLGNTTAPGATGTAGALAVQWSIATGNSNYGPFSQGEQGNTNFIAALEQTGKVLTFDYTTPTNNGGSYFELGILINCQGRFDQIFPSTTTSLGGGWTRASIPWTSEAALLATQQVSNGGAFSYFQMSFIWISNYNPPTPFYVDNIQLTAPPPTPVKLYTTTNDFGGWTRGVGFSNVESTNFDLDGSLTNGLGDTSAPGALGTGGSLNIYWASNTFGVATYSPDESGNAAFIARLLQPSTLTFDYTTPAAGSGNYFELGLTINCQGLETNLVPTGTTAVSNNITRASIDLSSEALALTAAQAANGGTFTYFQIGIVWNSNYTPSTNAPFQVDNIATTLVPLAPYIINAGSTVESESCLPTNGALSPGETVTVDLGLQNTGTSDASNVVATLLATGGVASPSGAQSYGTLVAGGVAVTEPFTFTADGTCGNELTATLLIQTNSVSLRSVPFGFTLGVLGGAVTNTYSTGGISVPIPDHGTNTSSIAVSSTGLVANVTVSIRMNHNYDGDVTIDLFHPDGTDVTLLSYNPENGGQNFGSGATNCTGTFTVFDDSAGTSIDNGSAPYDGSYSPEQPLSALNGKSTQGTWTLRVVDTDATSGDTGTLYCVQLEIAGQSYACCSEAVNSYTTWQGQYFTPAELDNPAFSGPDVDPLGKGMSNTNQFMAGFNPTNSAAYLHVITIAKTNNNADIRVTYLGASGDSTYTGGPASRTNVLEFTTGTANGSYTNNFASTGQTNILSGGTGLGVVTNMVDSGGATNKPSRYYRVRVLLP